MTQLMAPGGTREMAFTAIDEGADVVYVGPLGWSRRPYESELPDTEIKAVIDYAGRSGKEVRVVLNTYPSPFEFDAFLDKVKQYADWGASGFIVTDAGAISSIRRIVPATIIHVSIGSGITNKRDAEFYRTVGADAIILPYRWGTAEVAEVKEVSDIGLEVFLFETVQTGKICPGKCIMSSYLKFRDWLDVEGERYFSGSANRGAKECYRVCQATWEFGAPGLDSVELKLRRDAHLMLAQFPEYISLGVGYFKLSGRERPVAMIRDLVRFYRRVIDGIVRGTQTDTRVYLEELLTLRERWVSEKHKRVDTLMSRADGYAANRKRLAQS
ncbi:MAG: peptidase U32 family protein [Pseudomonadota bacterium]